MSEIKHLLYESNTEEIFTLTVEDSIFSGVYVINMPDGFNEIDCTVDINEDYFNIDNFILGDSEKIKFLEYSNPIAFDIVRKVYKEKGNEGKIIFGWKAVNSADEYDLLGAGYELNLNKYKESYDKSMRKIETEIKKREVQNKFLTREDISVNLFSEKDLDNLPVDPLVPDHIYFKEGGRSKSNFYAFHDRYKSVVGMRRFQFMFIRPSEYDLGNIGGEYVGWNYNSSLYKGPLLTATVTLINMVLEISNMNVVTDPHFDLNIIVMNGTTEVRRINQIVIPSVVNYSGVSQFEFKVVNDVFEIGVLNEGESIHVLFETTNGEVGKLTAVNTLMSFEVKSVFVTPLRRSRTIRLNNAIKRICRLSTGVDIPLQSQILNEGGYYFNTAVSTGIFIRSLPDLYNANKLTTSFKDLFYNSSSKLLALGFDLQDDKLIIEDISYFFKNIETYDFTDKEFVQDELTIENDVECSFNQLTFGSKKYSTKNKGDLFNFNTKLEALTPLRSVKTKFDKSIEAIIDEDKIQELSLDQSTTTNEGDDDLILIDLVELGSYEDGGILSNCEHSIEDGYLWLTSFELTFDVLAIEVGENLTIETGINAGTYEVLQIEGAKIKLNKTSGIDTGVNDTPVSYTVYNLTKNRNDEGFTTVTGVKDRKSATNLRHNPKYQLARWFPYFGSGLTKKEDAEEIIITNYKNNGDVTIEPNSSELNNELQNPTTLNGNETLARLRNYKTPFFNGEFIEITLLQVDFHEFFECYNIWRYSPTNNRGFITVKIVDEGVKIYPFGNGAFSFDGGRNELTIKGKIKSDKTI